MEYMELSGLESRTQKSPHKAGLVAVAGVA